MIGSKFIAWSIISCIIERILETDFAVIVASCGCSGSSGATCFSRKVSTSSIVNGLESDIIRLATSLS